MTTTEKKTGLGRGLSALLGEQPAPRAPDSENHQPIMLPIEFLQRNPEQPRRHFDDEKMQQLISSIRQQGVLQPILVRSIVGTSQYQIVAGERRWRAAGQAGLHEVPVYVRELSDREVVEVALVENMQRSDLNPVEEAQGYRTLIDQFHHTQEEVAKAVARSRSHIANTVRLLELPESVQEMLIDGQLSAGHARAILSAENPVAISEKVIDRGLSVRQTEKLVRDSLGKLETKSKKAPNTKVKDTDTMALESSLSEALGLKVSILQKKGNSGLLQIEYLTLEQLDDLCRRINTT